MKLNPERQKRTEGEEYLKKEKKKFREEKSWKSSLPTRIATQREYEN